MKRVCFLLPALVLMGNVIFAQTGGGIFAPFVSRLRADVNGRNILLSWVDSDSVKGSVYVFRSSNPFRQDTVFMDEGVEVPYGVRRYRDTVPSDGTWYYFVVASDNLQKEYDIIIPFNNTIDVTVGGTGGEMVEPEEYAPVFYSFSGTGLRPEPYQQAYADNRPYATTASNAPPATASPPATAYSAPPAYPPASAYSTPTDYPPTYAYTAPPATAYIITGIRATAVGNGIEITFLDSNPGKNAVLYRNIQPLRGFSDLITATVVAVNARSPYIDTPSPGTPYYYAVMYEDDLRNGHGEFYPGNNATLVPAEIPVSRNVRPPQTSDIPYYTQLYGGSPYEHYEEPYSGRLNRQSYGGSFYGQTRGGTGETVIIREPHIFNRDMQPAADVADKRLGSIVQGPFTWRDWQTARSNMAAYLAGNPPAAAANRARFYLAQCDYFLGDMRSALSEFLPLQQVYPNEVSTWIQACLNKIADR